jgi:hypothetical protein
MLQFGTSLLTTLAKARIINYDHYCSFIVLATVITIVNYDCHLFIVQATGVFVLTIKKTLAYYKIFQLSVNYESIGLYSTLSSIKLARVKTLASISSLM